MTVPFGLDVLRGVLGDPAKASNLPPTLRDLMSRDIAGHDATVLAPAPGIQMQQTGITPGQRGGHMPGVSEALYKYVTPDLYADADSAKSRVLQDVKAAAGMGSAAAPRPNVSAPQEDSWRLYLGLPERSREFGVSPYRPTQAKGDGAAYFRVHNFFERLVTEKARLTGTTPEEQFFFLVREVTHSAKPVQMSDDAISLDKNQLRYGVMQHFQMSHGKDEIGPYLAYYDKWDLHAPGADKIGKPYDLYDRMYYDPKTFAPIPEAEVLARKAHLNLTTKK